MMVNVQDYVQARPGLLSVSVNDEVVILQMSKGVYVNLNDTGGEILRRLEAPTQVKQLCNDLAELYEAPHDEIERDIIDIIQEMIEIDIVTTI